MAPSAKMIRNQLNLLKPILANLSLNTLRTGQDKMGELAEAIHRKQVLIKDHPFENFAGAWIIPKDLRREGVILYLHGGGYTCGSIDYATGFGSKLAVQSGARIFCAGYRLAPEHPYPAALEDALAAYRYLLNKGYAPSQICLCGESAGGGLCYSLCLKLKELDMPLPGSIIAISPWTDMTASGTSYAENKDLDPSMTLERLDFFAKCYGADPKDPLASPLFGDLHGMPPSLLFAGGDEIMRSDAQLMHQKLLDSRCSSTLVVRPERWHAYLLYGLAEDQQDFDTINRYLNQHLAQERKLRWLRLDNAAKIYPAARRQNWSNVFRLSATLKEPVDKKVLQSALDVTVRRFPSIAARLRRGVFWYYLQQLDHAPQIKPEYSYPLTRMSRDEIRRCAFRVIVHENRIAVELFHSLTDGNGALVFLKSLIAEYLQQKHGVHIPAEEGVKGRLEFPPEAELEDSFQKYGGNVNASRKENTSWQMSGTEEADGFLHVTCFRIPVKAALKKAHQYGVSLTVLLSAAMMMALQSLQEEKVPQQKKRKPIRLLIPVNLRNLFPSKTLRNFVMYTIPELLPVLGHYDFEEILRIVQHQMGAQITPKQMSMKIATNVSMERIMAVKIMPLFIKNIIMKAVFDAVGECKSCLSMSNLGAIKMPEIMYNYVQRMDFILGVQATAPYNCGCLSFGDQLYINFIRNIVEPDLERHFYRSLQQLGLPVMVESNNKE